MVASAERAPTDVALEWFDTRVNPQVTVEFVASREPTITGVDWTEMQTRRDQGGALRLFGCSTGG